MLIETFEQWKPIPTVKLFGTFQPWTWWENRWKRLNEHPGKIREKKPRRFSNHMSRLLSQSHTFAIIVILDLKIHRSMWIPWPFFPKTWTRGHWPLDDLWPHVCWGHMCDSTQGSLCPSPMTIHQCMDTVINFAKYHIHTHTYYVQNEWSHSLLLNSVQARQLLNSVQARQKT